MLTALPATALAAAPTEELAHARAGLAATVAQMHHSLAELVRRLDSRAGGGSARVWDEAIEAGVVHALHAAVHPNPNPNPSPNPNPNPNPDPNP